MRYLRASTVFLSLLCLNTALWAGPKEDASLLPPDTMMFLQADFAQLKNTQIFKDMVAKAPFYAVGLAEIKTKTGIDVEKDVKTITMGLLKGNEPDAVVVIIDTPLRTDSAALKERGVKKVSFAGQTYYRVGSKQDGAIANYKGRTIITQEKKMKEILKGKTGPSKALTKLSNGRDNNAQLWIFGTPPERATASAPFRPENIYGLVDLKSGMRIRVEADTTKEFAAQASATFNAEKKKMAGNPQLMAMGLGTVVNKIQFSTEGKRIKLSLALNDAELNQLVNVMKLMMMGGQAQPAPPMPKVGPAPVMPPKPPTGGAIKQTGPQ